MNLKKNLKTLSLIAFSLCATLSLSAQDNFKTAHASQHEKYIAGVNKNSNKIKNDEANKLINSVFGETSVAEEDLDVSVSTVSAEHGWDNPRVNCYTDVTVPSTANIDVTGFHMPVPGKVTSAYGYRPKFRRMHRGVDMRLRTGDEVCAAFSGRVRIVNYEANGYGNYVVIRHDNGLETVYGHLSKHMVKRGDYVEAGQTIGLGGNTGRSFGAHLHFETRYMGVAINPADIINFEKGEVHAKVFAFNKSSYQSTKNQSPSAAKKSYARKSYSKSTKNNGYVSSASEKTDSEK
ncbi:MAG: M23 family metallopeptidase [Muribaculaceae bacterium]|nr:M23 family metallopeptidase [Muribaculaceae bacterium]